MRQNTSERSRLRRLRSRYRKIVIFVGIVMLIVGILVGIVLDRLVLSDKDIPVLSALDRKKPAVTEVVTPAVTPAPTQPDDANAEPEATDYTIALATDEAEETPVPEEATPEPTAEPTAEATAEPTAEPTATPEPTATVEPTATPVPEPTTLAVVPFGESYTYNTQIRSDGMARIEATDDAYETLSFTQTMVSYMRPADFADKYASQYKLSGTEAGAGFELVLNDYTGEQTIVPQNVIKFTLESESGETVELGYQLMDAEISGNYGIKVDSNVPKVLYKRYQYSNSGEEMKYLVVTTYNDGAIGRILFELESDVVPEPDPAVTYTTLRRGSRNDDVARLQQRLIDLSYLTGSADGQFGAMTESAVKQAQLDFGMEETGVADDAFQQRLFSDAVDSEEGVSTVDSVG